MGSLVRCAPVVTAVTPSSPDLSDSFWRGRRVLLTGHTGFKGSWLALWLRCLGAEVLGVALPPDTQPSLYEELLLEQGHDLAGCLRSQLLDLADLPALKAAVLAFEPQVVFHLAAQPLVRLSYAEPLSTWNTDVIGTLHLLEALRPLQQPCAVVAVTTDKVYRNQEWCYGYRENDPLGGHDPYSSSKAAAELLIQSWRQSFCGALPHQTPNLAIATARAGNVIGGGDWAADRIVPDAMRACAGGAPLTLRNPSSTRPWQHVLEPLSGYLLLAQRLWQAQQLGASGELELLSAAWNFGPSLASNATVQQLVEALHASWPGSWRDASDPQAPHEAGLLHLVTDKAHHQLGWAPRWDLATTAKRTARWYQRVQGGAAPLACCLEDLEAYVKAAAPPPVA